MDRTSLPGDMFGLALRPSASQTLLRYLVEIDGSCNCGSDDSVFVRDANGAILRQQDARGYVTARTYYLNGRASTIATFLKPSGCDPDTDPAFCRQTPDELATVTLVASPMTTTTALTYGDANWTDRPTLITTDSLRAGQQKQETFTYDATTGAVLTHTTTGYDPAAQAVVQMTRTTTTSLYNGTEGAAFDPCSGGTCDFSGSWMTLPQPIRQPRQIDGPRTNVNDWTTYVYYPFDGAVPANARGRIAGARNAAGHITMYEDYDVFGNARRVVDPNGVITTSTYDAIGRLLTSTIKGVPGCDTNLDPVCGTDAVTHRLYADSGALTIEVRPMGEATTYEFDGHGRMTAVMRGLLTGTVPSTASAAIAAASWKERLAYEYSPTTGHKTAERVYAWESGAWSQKKWDEFAYDTDGHLSTITHADSTTISYGYDRGQLGSVRDENHANPATYPEPNTKYVYDGSGRLQTVSQRLQSAPNDLITTSYAYDKQGNLTSVTDPNGNVTSYIYDDFGQMTKQESGRWCRPRFPAAESRRTSMTPRETSTRRRTATAQRPRADTTCWGVSRPRSRLALVSRRKRSPGPMTRRYRLARGVWRPRPIPRRRRRISTTAGDCSSVRTVT